jgi:hypothetical protein
MTGQTLLREFARFPIEQKSCKVKNCFQVATEIAQSDNLSPSSRRTVGEDWPGICSSEIQSHLLTGF